MKGIRHFMRDFTATAVREHLRSAVATGGQAPDLTKNELALVRFMCEGSFDWNAFLAPSVHALDERATASGRARARSADLG
jgi:hypothetical protein